MRILFLDWGCFGKAQAIRTMEDMRHIVFPFAHKEYQNQVSESFVREATAFMKSKRIDLCFSFNYYPVLADAAYEMRVPYVSFLYDSPYVYIYDRDLSLETNHVFVFDGGLADELIAAGHTNVHYMLLPADTSRMAQVRRGKDPKYDADVSFVGALYDEEHNFYDQMYPHLTEYLQGYLEGVMQAQSKVYGAFLLEELLADDVVRQLVECFPLEKDAICDEPDAYRYANYVLARKLTGRERLFYLVLTGQYLKRQQKTAKIYTLNEKMRIDGIQNMGIASYETAMPQVFAQSRINLNISLRSIRTGVPLRCMDVFSCGGFLLTNYQADLLAHFVPGEDFDYFTNEHDYMEKVEYYLSHEKERVEIAENGYHKAVTEYSYEKIFSIIFEMVKGTGV